MESEVQASPLPAPLAQPLVLDIDKVKGEVIPASAQPQQDAAIADNDPLRAQAEEMVKRLVSITPDRYDEARAAIDTAGGKVMQVASHQSDMLKGKLGPLMSKTEDGGPVAQALIALRDQVSVLDPSGINFTPARISRMLGSIPVVGDPVRRYFNRFETGQGAINSVIKSLENGKATLQNDNNILATDQRAWRENTQLLQRQITYLRAMDAALEAQIPGISDPEHQNFLKGEIQFPLRQRIQDLLQRLSVNQQGVLVSEVLIRNNRELIRGVDRALFVTVDALNIAVAAAMALANQKLVLDAVDALNTTTNTLIAGTAQRLRAQGAEIQKRASSTTLDSQVLLKAFEDIKGAINDISAYRQKALPEMAKQIIALDATARDAEKVISRLEHGDRIAATHELAFDVDGVARK